MSRRHEGRTKITELMARWRLCSRLSSNSTAPGNLYDIGSPKSREMAGRETTIARLESRDGRWERTMFRPE